MKFLIFESGKLSSATIVDLTEAYQPAPKSALSGVALVEGKRALLLQDEFVIDMQCDIDWGMTTDTEICPDGNTALLEKDGEKLTAKILSPPDARFSVGSASRNLRRVRTRDTGGLWCI